MSNEQQQIIDIVKATDSYQCGAVKSIYLWKNGKDVTVHCVTSADRYALACEIYSREPGFDPSEFNEFSESTKLQLDYYRIIQRYQRWPKVYT